MYHYNKRHSNSYNKLMNLPTENIHNIKTVREPTNILFCREFGLDRGGMWVGGLHYIDYRQHAITFFGATSEWKFQKLLIFRRLEIIPVPGKSKQNRGGAQLTMGGSQLFI